MAKKKKRTTKKKGENRIVRFFKSQQTHLIFGVFLMLFAVFLLISFFSFFSNWQSDQSQLLQFADRGETAQNLLGKIGAQISHFFVYDGFGLAAFILPILLFFTGLVAAFKLQLKLLRKVWFLGLIFMVWISLALGFFVSAKPLFGGVVGYELNDFLSDYIGRTGVFLVLLFSLLAYIISKLDGM